MKAWKYFTTQKQWEEFLKDYLDEDIELLKRAIILIYQNQTFEEKCCGETKEENKIGFSKVDAGPLGNIAKKLLKNQELTNGEIAMSRNKMKKYWKQLMNIAKQNLVIKAEEFVEESDFRVEDKATFSSVCSDIRRCIDEGISCGYGICSECPVTTNFQIRINTMEL